MENKMPAPSARMHIQKYTVPGCGFNRQPPAIGEIRPVEEKSWVTEAKTRLITVLLTLRGKM
jgi:hypothetical protein